MSRRVLAALAGAVLVLCGVLWLWKPELAAGIFSIAFASQVLQTSVPYALAALGGSITERAGVIDLALEAKLLFGAFAAAAVAHWSGSAYVGVLGGIAAGVLVAALQMVCALRLGADQVIVGVALNLLALSGTRFLLQLFYGESSNSPETPAFHDLGVGNPIVWIAVIAAVAVPFALVRTRWGLRLRAAGDRPESLIAVGASPARARLAAGLIGGALAGAGGAQLSLSVEGFSADMSSGRGYIAIAMVILAGWRPAWAALACVGVVVAATLNIQLQVNGPAIPRELAPLLPYVLTLVVLIIAGGKRRPPPGSLGKL
jgi:simple sugar transport system permease protein